MGAFWCILLSFFTIKAFWKSERRKAKERKAMRPDLPATNKEKLSALGQIDKQEKEERQKQADIEELRKLGYTDDIITMIIPTINNGQ